MKKTLILAAVVALTISSTGLAQDSTLFFDIRDNTSANQLIDFPTYPYTVGALNLGKAGDAQTLYISPDYSDSWETQYPTGWPNNDADGNNSTGKIWLYMDVNLAAGGGTGVISSVGLDMPITAPVTPKNPLGSLAFAWDAGIGWSGSSDGTSDVTGVVGAKAVKVPVSQTPPADPVFDATGGLVPTARYRVGALSIVGGARVGGFGAGYEAASTYTLKLTVNGLLITRVFNGAVPDTTEDVAFGYAAGIPEAPYVDGSVSGGSSALPDATIVVNAKGDFNGDGRCTVLDNSSYVTARNAGTAGATQRQVFMGDTSGDRRVTVLDNSGFTANRSRPAP